MSLYLTDHFTLDELIASDAATRHGINNSPGMRETSNLHRVAQQLELVRDLLGGPIKISSGYRCPALNALIGGAGHSAHMDGLAADFTCPDFGSPYAVVAQIMANADVMENVDQLIYEFGRWVHLGLADEQTRPRQQVLSIRSKAEGYQSGLVKL